MSKAIQKVDNGSEVVKALLTVVGLVMAILFMFLRWDSARSRRGYF